MNKAIVAVLMMSMVACVSEDRSSSGLDLVVADSTQLAGTYVSPEGRTLRFTVTAKSATPAERPQLKLDVADASGALVTIDGAIPELRLRGQLVKLGPEGPIGTSPLTAADDASWHALGELATALDDATRGQPALELLVAGVHGTYELANSFTPEGASSIGTCAQCANATWGNWFYYGCFLRVDCVF